MKQELNIKSIKPKVLRDRKDLSLLQKTAIYRYNYDGSDTYLKWFNHLNCVQKLSVCIMGLIPFKGSEVIIEREKIKKIKL